MLFNSFSFLLFFSIVTVLFFAIPHKFRWFLLLVSSCCFYMCFVPSYIFILFFTIIVDYFAGIFIEQAVSQQRRKLFLVASLIANIGILVAFKYFNFINDNIHALADFIGWNYSVESLKIILPIGLSFHTFQAMSYTIEVYRGGQKAERHFGIYALYVMFYPQLVAGPIERPQNLLHQFREDHSFKYKHVSDGLKLMAWGLFKKVVIADRLAMFVDEIYKAPQSFHGLYVIWAVVIFAFQIYCDFSGYSDIAIGSAKVMGFDLMQNFNFPFISKSITEFWRRWHISLSTWFNDYLFTPLYTSLRDYGNSALCFSLFVTFFLSGLWHGAGWNFIIYGILQGLILIYEVLTKKMRKKWASKFPDFIYSRLTIVLTFSYVAFSWIFFRANHIADAFTIIRNMVDFYSPNPVSIYSYTEYTIAILFVFLLLWLENIIKSKGLLGYINSQPLMKRWIIYSVFLLLILNFGVFGGNSFIYFQF